MRDDALNRGAVIAAGIAASLGAASAAMSAYWALGGTALLDIVGGEIESWGRERSASVGATDDADERAIAWHAFFWDPWFALWGGAFTVAMWRSRPQAPDTEGE